MVTFFKKFRFISWVNKSSNLFISFKELTRFSDNQTFKYLVYAANFMRDIVTLVVKIALDIVLIYFFNLFRKRRFQLTGRQNETLSNFEKKNIITTIIIGILTIFSHILSFMVKLFFSFPFFVYINWIYFLIENL